jgi:hypothetical protein
MNAKTYESIQAKVDAIKADPIEWARSAEKRFQATMGSAAMFAVPPSEEQLREYASEHLQRAEALLEGEEPEAEEPIDMERLQRANARTRRAIEGLES